MATSPNHTRAVERSFARTRLADAHTFRRQAEITIELIDATNARKVAASSAVLAAIAAADAACATALGLTWKGEHTKASTLLRQVAGGSEAAIALGRIVASKTEWQYLERDVTEAALIKALRQADKVIAFAEGVVRAG